MQNNSHFAGSSFAHKYLHFDALFLSPKGSKMVSSSHMCIIVSSFYIVFLFVLFFLFLYNIFGRTRFPFVRRPNKGDHNVYLGRYYAKVSTSKYFKRFLLERVIVRSVFGARTSVICRYRFFFAYPCLYNKNV